MLSRVVNNWERSIEEPGADLGKNLTTLQKGVALK